MATKSSIRSASHISSKPNSNSNSSNGQESMDNIRRSFASNRSKFSKPSLISQPRTLNPITTPANTPTEYSRRSSYGKDDYEQKENEQDMNPQHPRLRSPSDVKGSKNFMSPTISAASKINASPRKRVLGERNEAIRTSASFSAGKFHFYSTAPSETETETYALHGLENEPKLKPEDCPQSNTALEASMAAEEFQKVGTENLIEEPAINLTAPDDGKNKLEPELEPDVVVLSPLKSPNQESVADSVDSMLPPHGPRNNYLSPNQESVADSVDSMLPPYDPKNNYLSPRPRFLHYKPKPRVEAYVNREIQFDDEFVPENSYETQGSNEETSSSKDSGEETAESLQFSEYCESSQISESCNAQLVKENVESEVVTQRKSSYFTFTKVLVFILVMSLAFPFAIHAPSITGTWNHDQVTSKWLHESHKVAGLAREHMESWLDNLKLKLVLSFDHLSSISGGFGKAKKFHTLKFTNVTDLPDYEGWDHKFEKCKRDTFSVEKGSIELLGDKMEISGYDGSDYELEKVTTDTSGEQTVNTEAVGDKMQIAGNTEEYMYEDYPKVENDLGSEDHVDFSDQIQVTQPYLEDKELQESSTFSAAEEDTAVENVFMNSEVVTAEREQYPIETDREESGLTAQENIDTSPYIADEPKIMVEEEEHVSPFSTGPNLERSTSPVFGEWQAKFVEVVHSLKQLLADNKVAASVVSAAVLLLATILVFLKLRKTTKFPQQQGEMSKPLSKLIAARNIKPQTSCSQSGPAPEEFEEMEGESCPSEISSSQRENQGADEAYSHGRSSVRRNHKRESLVSTSSEYSMGSPSYGSFTTYSIVQNKNGDEEVVTPLRRSSRIRNKVTY